MTNQYNLSISNCMDNTALSIAYRTNDELNRVAGRLSFLMLTMKPVWQFVADETDPDVESLLLQLPGTAHIVQVESTAREEGGFLGLSRNSHRAKFEVTSCEHYRQASADA